MATQFEIDGMRIDRIIEGEYPFTPASDFLPRPHAGPPRRKPRLDARLR